MGALILSEIIGDDMKVGGLGLDEICIVHATRYKPSVDNQGRLSIQTTFDALGGFDQSPETFTFRNSIHTALNGVVSAHTMGNWDDMGYVVVSPFQHTLDLNGPPAGFCTVDTYWAREANSPLKLSEYRLISPEDPKDDPFDVGEFFREDGNIIYYKTNFTDEDRLAFLSDFLYKKHHGCNRYLVDDESQKSIKIKVFGKFLDTLKDSEVSGAGSRYSPPFIEAEDDIDLLERVVMTTSPADKLKIDGVIRQFVRDYAVNYTLREYDAPVRLIGNNYWCDGDGNRGEYEMSRHVGAKHHGMHTYSAQKTLENMLNGGMILGVCELSAPHDIRAFIEEKRDELPESSIKLAVDLVKTDLYEAARSIRAEMIAEPENVME